MTTTTDRPATPFRRRGRTRRRSVRRLVTVAVLALLVLRLFDRFGPTSPAARDVGAREALRELRLAASGRSGSRP